MEDGRDAEPGGAHLRRHAGEPHRIVGLGDIVRIAFVEHGARVDDARLKPDRLQAQADGARPAGRTQANRERLRAVAGRDLRQDAQALFGQLAIEERERPRAGTNDGEPMLDGGERVELGVIADAHDAERGRVDGGGELELAERARDRAGHHAATGHEGEHEIRGRRQRSDRDLVDAHAKRSPELDRVGRVEGAGLRPGRHRRRHQQHRRRPVVAQQRQRVDARQHDEVDGAGAHRHGERGAQRHHHRLRQHVDARVDAEHLQRGTQLLGAERSDADDGHLERRVGVLAQERGHGGARRLADGGAEQARDRRLAPGARRPERGDAEPARGRLQQRHAVERARAGDEEVDVLAQRQVDEGVDGERGRTAHVGASQRRRRCTPTLERARVVIGGRGFERSDPADEDDALDRRSDTAERRDGRRRIGAQVGQEQRAPVLHATSRASGSSAARSSFVAGSSTQASMEATSPSSRIV